MFSVKNRSNIRQVTPYGEYGPFEAKTFYPVSKVYANAKAFFLKKPQFEVFEESLPVEPVKASIPKSVPTKPVETNKPVETEKTPEAQKPVQTEEQKEPQKETTEEKPKQEEAVTPSATTEEVSKPAEAPVAQTKPKARRSL